MARNTKRSDFVEHGSEQHAAIIGLRKAMDEDAFSLEGWTLVDQTAFGVQATEAYLREVLRQKVSVLNAGAPPKPQSKDPFETNYAPTMWTP